MAMDSVQGATEIGVFSIAFLTVVNVIFLEQGKSKACDEIY